MCHLSTAAFKVTYSPDPVRCEHRFGIPPKLSLSQAKPAASKALSFFSLYLSLVLDPDDVNNKPAA
ncbi:Piso0_003020 [Millerozyma farinosa CBS 7064]|uniref:Piso0_003020 protein n=1 Tax=Pichia sorbitophila (strain ATCC MYA-4447 / BCRC 22081 / CBS 7064 / NBRC 10061 / NRRL Y-12695) TaxID=559304 RepID=G8YGZ0_PICSO|nr:Piso0_003020 [Millerozyma farinosa CBS 7064]CCE80692.1 Piso0_003020 [Millerozyma farinosa CBS 7064]